METTTRTSSRSRRRRKLTPEENRALNAAMVPGNKYMEAAKKYAGKYKLVINDPNWLL
jgi:hypothetical protein